MLQPDVHRGRLLHREADAELSRPRRPRGWRILLAGLAAIAVIAVASPTFGQTIPGSCDGPCPPTSGGPPPTGGISVLQAGPCTLDSSGNWTITITGTMPVDPNQPNPAVDIVFDDGTGNPVVVQVSDAGGHFSVTLSIPEYPPPPNAHTIRGYQDSSSLGSTPSPNSSVTTNAVSVTCPYAPPPTTTTPPTSQNTPPPTRKVPGTTATPGTPGPSGLGGKPVTLTVDPPIGPPGQTTLATGTGWPPGPVTLVWRSGLGSFNAVADANGNFQIYVFVMPRDEVGPRNLVGTEGTVTAQAAYLVVPDTVQPPDNFAVRR